MIPDWKFERYLTGDLPAEEMRKLREMEATDEVFASRVKMFREDNAAILKKMPFEALASKMENHGERDTDTRTVTFRLVKFAAAAVLVFAFVGVSILMKQETPVNVEGTELASGVQGENGAEQVAMAEIETGTRIKGMENRMEVWKKTEKGIVQLENLSEAREGDEIQLRYSVPQKCFGLLFSMDGNGALTIHMGDDNKAIALEPGKMVTLPFAYKLDNAPKFEKFFLITSQNTFELDASKIDDLLKRKDVSSKTLTLRKVDGGK